MWMSPTQRGCVCPAQLERRGRDYEPLLWSLYPSDQCQQECREILSQPDTTADTRGAGAEQEDSLPLILPCHLLEIYDFLSIASELLFGAIPFMIMVVILSPPSIICS